MTEKSNIDTFGLFKFQVKGTRLRSKNRFINERYDVVECGLHYMGGAWENQPEMRALCNTETCPIYQTWKLLKDK